MNERKVWITQVSNDVTAGSELMIEQFGDKPPSIAFRPAPWETWGPPVPSTVAP